MLHRLRRIIRDILRYIKWTFQRTFRGYSDCDIWGLYTTIAKFILPRLKAFRACKRMGYPAPLDTGKGWEYHEKQWDKILDKMILAFQMIVDDKGWIPEEYKPIDQGLKLFIKYFVNLWD